jgi:hypothetical protein
MTAEFNIIKDGLPYSFVYVNPLYGGNRLAITSMGMGPFKFILEDVRTQITQYGFTIVFGKYNLIELFPTANDDDTIIHTENYLTTYSAFNYTGYGLFVDDISYRHYGAGTVTMVVGYASCLQIYSTGDITTGLVNRNVLHREGASTGVFTKGCTIGAYARDVAAYANRTFIHIAVADNPFSIPLPDGFWSIYDTVTDHNYHAGPVLSVAVQKDDDFDIIRWGVAGTVGAYWTQRLSGGPGTISLITPARGGIVNIASLAATDPTYLYENAVLTVSIQDYPVLCIRHRTVEIANTRKYVGYTNGVDVAENYPWDVAGGTGNGFGIMIDTSVGAFVYSVGVRAGVVTTHPIIALTNEHHRFMLAPTFTAAGIFDGYNVWCEGTLIVAAKLTVAELPLTTTMMERTMFSTNLNAAVSSNLRVDYFKDGIKRYTGVGDT